MVSQLSQVLPDILRALQIFGKMSERHEVDPFATLLPSFVRTLHPQQVMVRAKLQSLNTHWYRSVISQSSSIH